MEDSAQLYAGSIPALYDRYRGPVFFEPFARDLAERLADLRAGSLLEIAAGTGIVTRVLARVLPETVSIVASDISQDMLDFAQPHPVLRESAGDTPTRWRCRSTTRRSMRSFANSASCSFATGSPATARRGGC